MVYLISINYNSSALTIDFLKSLSSVATPYRLIVVDNHSTEDDYEGLLAYMKTDTSGLCVSENESFLFGTDDRVLLMRAAGNLGFAGGNNLALRTAMQQKDMDAVVLINNDTLVSPGFLDEILACSVLHPEAGLMGCRILYADSPDTIWYDGGRFFRHTTRSIHIHQDQLLKDVPQSTEPHPTEFITGCCLYISRKSLETIGLLDERFFMYNEDLEYCIRAAKAGIGMYHVPSAVIWHKVSPEPSAFSAYWGARNRFRVSRLHASYSDRIFTFVFYILTRIPIFTKWVLAGKYSLAKAQWKGLLDGLKNMKP